MDLKIYFYSLWFLSLSAFIIFLKGTPARGKFTMKAKKHPKDLQEKGRLIKIACVGKLFINLKAEFLDGIGTKV